MSFEKLFHTTSPGDLAIVTGLVDLLHERFKPPITIIEVGCWVGETTRELARSPDHLVYCVDNFCGNATGLVPGEALLKTIAEAHTPHGILKIFAQNMEGRFLRNITPCMGTSDFWREIWPFPVHLIFIDADHSYSAVKKDLGWWDHVLPGGILCGHDYYSFPGVRQAVDESEFGCDGVEGEVWWKNKK